MSEYQISPRAIGDASDAETKRALAIADEICEWELLGQTYILSKRLLIIIRTDSMGGDTRSIEYAWKYPHNIALLLDWNEILSVPLNEPAIRKRYRA